MTYPPSASPGESESEMINPAMQSPSTSTLTDQQNSNPYSFASSNDSAPAGDTGGRGDLVGDQMHDAKSKGKLVPAKGWVHFVAGGAGGMCGAIITSPLDVVKTRLQSDLFQQKSRAAPSGAGVGGALGNVRRLAYHFVETGYILREIATKEGPRALFKGLGPTLVGVIPARSINFYTYGNGKQVLAERFNNGKESPLVHLSAAAIAGLVTATATNPIWVVKTRLQLESHQVEQSLKATRAAAVIPGSSASSKKSVPPSKARYSTTAVARFLRPSPTWSNRSIGLTRQPAFFKSSPSPPRPGLNGFQTAFQIVRQEGVKGLYKGMSASYLGVAEGTIQWVLYEKLKKLGQNEKDPSSFSSNSTRGGQWFNTVGAAGLAKFVASLITYPHEVIRTRLRQQPKAGEALKYTGLLQTVKVVLREEGAAALYGGLSAHLLRVVPNAAVMFSIYEITLRLGSTNEEKR
ncbi:mitochondrial carrier [Violaceomyces palustris]|uniref:Mitochondrial carrier n=1 Tax=Violaceomyces palustris TaxID=1673888 RepID=A0ACD0NRW9_9BASI|nr:mitochondrial carrier [Violaceomyces palustris]